MRRCNNSMQRTATAWWPALYEKITKRNMGVRMVLRRFGPERLDGLP